MDGERLEATKLAAYFLWEHTNYKNALELWYCAEDIAMYLKTKHLIHQKNIDDIVHRGVYNYSYVSFIRNIAFRLFVYTKNNNSEFNWYAAEKLISNKEWCYALLKISTLI